MSALIKWRRTTEEAFDQILRASSEVVCATGGGTSSELLYEGNAAGKTMINMLPSFYRVNALLIIFLFVVEMFQWTKSTNREVKELCQFDSFYGRCADDEIISIDHAHYGRMKTGRCISGEGYIGCETDVRAYMDSSCAGRRHCNVSVASLTDVVQPCKKDYTSYLEVVYSCRKVATDGVCRRRSDQTPSTGLLASIVALETKTGSVQCPWEIRGLPGQQVRLKLVIYRPGLDLDPSGTGASASAAAAVGAGASGAACPWFVVVEEGGKALSEALCGRMKSQRTLAVSDGNFLRVYFTWEGRQELAPVFVVQFEVIGCPDIVAGSSSGALVTRTGDELVVRCRETRETWYLTCSGNSWIGDFENCSTSSQRSSHRASASAAGGGVGSGIPFHQGLVIAVILGLILGLFVGSASLAALFVFRRRRHRSNDVLRGGGGGEEEEDDYATEKLRATDLLDPEGYRSTGFSQYQTGSDVTVTSTTMDILGGHHRSPRCLAFYSGGGGSTRSGEGCFLAGRTLSAATANAGRSPSDCVMTVGSPVRSCALVMDTATPCAPTAKGVQSPLTYETTRPCPGGVPSAFFVDPPKLYFELDLAQQRRGCATGAGIGQTQT